MKNLQRGRPTAANSDHIVGRLAGVVGRARGTSLADLDALDSDSARGRRGGGGGVKT